MPLAAKLNLLDRRGIRVILPPLVSAIAKWQGNGVERIFCDQGVWIHQTRSGSFAYQWPYLRLNLQRFQELTRENFFWGYQPRAGDVIVDVGAGVGEETLTFSRAVGDRGRVICIEAHPRTFACLEKMVQYNRLFNVTALHTAISEPGGHAVTIEDSSDYLKNRVSRENGMAVPATTLDAIHQELGLGRIHFLKMNIEGAERFAIHGMTEILKHIEVLCICCHDFLGEISGDDSLKTKSAVREFVQASRFTVRERLEPGLPRYVRDQLWAYNPCADRRPDI